MKRCLLLAVVIGLLFCANQQLNAALLYSNGPPTGFSAEAIYSPQGETTNSFVLAQPSLLTEIHAALQLIDRPSQPSSLDWAIGTTPFSNDRGFGTVSLSNTLLFHPGASGVWDSSFTLNNVPLTAGTYYLTLQNAVSTSGDGIFWDRAPNGSPSVAYFFHSEDANTYEVPSESFQIYGTPVPEPASLTLLGLGMVGLAGITLRKRKSAA